MAAVEAATAAGGGPTGAVDGICTATCRSGPDCGTGIRISPSATGTCRAAAVDGPGNTGDTGDNGGDIDDPVGDGDGAPAAGPAAGRDVPDSTITAPDEPTGRCGDGNGTLAGTGADDAVGRDTVKMGAAAGRGIRSAAAADCAVAVAGAVSIPPVTRATCGCRRTSMDAPATGLPSTYNCARTTGPGRAGTVSMLRMSITFATCATGGGRPSMSMIARPVPMGGRAPAGCSRPIRVPAGTGSGSSSATRPMLPCATTRRPMLSATVRSSRRRLAAFDAALFAPSARPVLTSPAAAPSPAVTGSRGGMPPTPLMLRSARAS